MSPSSGLHVLYICRPALGCMSLAILYICLPALPCLPLACNPLHVSPSSDCCVRLCLAIRCTCLPALDCCIHLCLAILKFTCVSQLSTAISAFALHSFVSQLWTSQTLVAECSDLKTQTVWGLRRCNLVLMSYLIWVRTTPKSPKRFIMPGSTPETRPNRGKHRACGARRSTVDL